MLIAAATMVASASSESRALRRVVSRARWPARRADIVTEIDP
jgi:hypothetical protein